MLLTTVKHALSVSLYEGIIFLSYFKEKRIKKCQRKPSGWHTIKYDNVDGKYLYNRCHLIGYQLTAENANEKNLITGTRYLNVQGMLPFENMAADYVKETGNHVLYRVTPVFEGSNRAGHTGCYAGSFSADQHGILYPQYQYKEISSAGLFIGQTDEGEQ